MSNAITRGPGDELPFTAATDIPSGTIMQVALMSGIVEGLNVKAGDAASLRIRVRADVDSATATVFTAGDAVGWDDTGKLAVVGGAGTFDIGIATADKASGPLFVSVLFNEFG